MKTLTPAPRLNLIHLAWPMFIEELTGGITSFADTWFTSMISDEAAASVGILGPILMLGYFILPQFTSAGTSVASQYIGAGEKHKIIPTWVANILISTISGTVLAAVLFAFSGSIGLWLGMTESQNAHAQAYLSVIAFNFIIVGLRNSYASILASQTLTRWNMVASIVTNLINVPLNYALMSGWGIFPEMGLRGIALATVISYFIGFLIIFFMVHVKLGIRFREKGMGKRIREVVPPILKVGIPTAMEPFSYTMQSFVVSMIIIRLGTVSMAANTYVNKFIFLDQAASWALTMGGQILISHHLGANRIEDVRKEFWRIAGIIAGFALLIMLPIFLLRGPLLAFFTRDPEILALSAVLLGFSVLMEPIRSMNILGGVALKSVGDGVFSVVISLVFMWGLVPLLVLAVSAGWGIVGVWSCLLLDETVRALINAWRWKSGRWIGKRVIDEKGN
ncbi:MAG: MATE family efflux transporter [Spirochaetales bacterium]|nr:MATE family efflux transporter [Spirochaetales bacterium]